MKNNWTIEKENPKLRDKLAKSLQISPITAQILVNRGIENETEANLFLNCTLFDLPSPYLMKGMDRAVERIKKALENNERIAIYGDYDVDGVTSTALLYSFLKVLKANVTYYNPDRLKEGYGINIDAVKKLAEQGVSLIISGDCGITAVKEIEQAKELGVEFIVTDHHQPPQELPRAVSILNPKLSECKYPGKEIVGVGVIFNLVIALRRALRDEGFFKNGEPNLGDYLDLVALGTVADCAPLLDVNRILVKEGIKRMQSPKRLGVQALKEASSIKGEVTSYDLGFKLGPRINASGRMSTAENAVALFISENLEEARELARELNEKNSNRQSTEAEIIKEAISLLESNPALIGANSIVLASRNWHPGIIGIVASRIVERYEKPTMLIAISEDGVGKGSGRSLEGINIYAALSECRELFLQFGGHEQAAGLSIREENVEKFREMFDKALENSEEQYEKKLKVDCSIELDSLTDSLISEFELLQPFGIGNPEPALLSRTVEVVSQRIFKDKHLGFKVKKGTKLFDAIWFNMKEPFTLPDKVDMVFTPEFNKWNGKKEIRLRVKDVSW
ncbi:MAG: single-stranded-DNA-specific exonuclease RecJ [Candidatus Dadabacteria bacterium]|nr:MAG: single-stranded-DNA-specific exonuclease RecJ [Candidatus Dadabacteria bacterium]